MHSHSNRNKYRHNPVYNRVARLVVFYTLLSSIHVFAGQPPPSIKQCKSKWTVLNTNSTTGMSFGDFAVESSGSITLNTGSTRTADPTIDLLSAGGLVNTHQLVVDNTKNQVVCAGYGIDIDWVADPSGTSMSGPTPGPAIGLSNVTVYINGVATPLPTGIVTTYTLPLNIEITSTMTTANSQTSGTYTSPIYEIGVTQSGTLASQTGTAVATAFVPLTLTPGTAMDFGTIAAGTNATTVSVDAAGAVTAPVGAGNAVVTVSAGSALTYDVQAATGLTYSLNIADGSLDDGPGGGNAMVVTIVGNDDPGVGTGGPVTVTVWGDLSVGSNQAAGNYSTTLGVPIVITVNYN